MKNRSFFFQLLSGSLAIIGAVLVVLSLVAYTYLDRNFKHEQLQWQRKALLLLQEDFHLPAGVGGLQAQGAIQADCRRLADLIGSHENRITLVNVAAYPALPVGKVLGDSEVADVGAMELHDKRPEVVAALAGDIGHSERISETTGPRYSYMAAPLYGESDVGGEVQAVVRLAMPIRTLVEGRRAIGRILTWSAVLAALVSAGLAMLISGLWSRPLVRITQTAGRLAAGDLQARAVLGGSRELDTLARALNDMREGLSEKLQTIADQRENLRTVLTNLRDGVIAADADKSIVYINESAVALLSIPADAAPLGRHIQAVVREPGILDLLRGLDERPRAEGQVRVHHGAQRRTLDVHAAPVASGGPSGIRYLLVLNDITELERMATIKAEFVANASHELRTPLATLRVAVDSIIGQYRADGEQGRLADILDRQLRRLEHMTADLLDLHWVEHAEKPALDEDIPTTQLARSLADRFGDAAADGGIALRIDNDCEELTLRSDRRMLELILHNLLDNALKFTPREGEVRLHVAMPREGCVRMEVRDSGPGIPEEARARIFERFYQVDSSRTGDSVKRGTGLGLAIVKYAVDKLGGRLTLDCPETGGSVFTLELPA